MACNWEGGEAGDKWNMLQRQHRVCCHIGGTHIIQGTLGGGPRGEEG
jgi:hypothetical protein